MPSDADATCLSCATVNPLGSRACRVCGARLEVSVYLPAGERIGNFVLESVLGRGGFGITYRARDAGTGEIVALKELFPEGLAARADDNAVRIPSSSLAEWEQLKTRFTLEAQLLQRIKHKACTHFKALFEANDTLYLAMEFVQGETLEARLQSGKRLGMKAARSLLKDVLGVLEEVHAANLLHRDIKPANIIMQPGGAELIDFGSGIYFQENRTMKISQRLLTPAYAPLELYGSNVRLSPAADLYSLAATVYEAVSGVRPPSALERANGAKLESLAELRPDISEHFAKAIDAALSVRVDARPQSVAAFRALLELKAPQAPSVRKKTLGSKVVASPQAPVPAVINSSDNDMFGGAALTLGVVFFTAFIATVILDGSEFWQRVMQSVGVGGVAGMVAFFGGWLLITPLRNLFDRFRSNKASRILPMSFYRQSMLGIYSFVPSALFCFSGVGGLRTMYDFERFIIPFLFMGYLIAFFGLFIAITNARLNPSTPAKPRVLGIWQTLGLHIAIACFIAGWFFSSLFFNVG